MIVVDTNILSYLARAGYLSELLAAFAGQIAATPLVLSAFPLNGRKESGPHTDNRADV